MTGMLRNLSLVRWSVGKSGHCADLANATLELDEGDGTSSQIVQRMRTAINVSRSVVRRPVLDAAIPEGAQLRSTQRDGDPASIPVTSGAAPGGAVQQVARSNRTCRRSVTPGA